MATRTGTQRVGDAARSVASNPYLRRLIEDEELRRNIRNAFDAVVDAGRRMNGQPPAEAILDDEKIHSDLREAAESLKRASDQLRGRKKPRSFGLGKAILVAIAGAVLVLILSEDARRAVLGLIFGAEEEFEYVSAAAAPEAPSVPTTPAS